MDLIAFAGSALLIWASEGPFGRFLASKGLVRRNYAGRPIPTSYGVLLLLASLPFYLLAASVPGDAGITLRISLAAFAFGLLGFADDRWGDRSVGGLKGHFRKLLHEREMTTGAVKALAGGWVAVILAGTLHPGQPLPWAVSALLIALTANSLNLVDTRPARAVALFLAGTGLVLVAYGLKRAGIPAALWVLPGAALAYLPVERARRGMLGDSGANGLGGALGFMFAMAFGFWVQLFLVGALLGFHAFTERRSLNEYIREHPRLHRFDLWVQGRDQEADEK
ncbi:MAG: hypothetical protein KY468_08825 [Armatimonadetes bacterium]|nr:hypothetical protein [Armatimonadota bacterium]